MLSRADRGVRGVSLTPLGAALLVGLVLAATLVVVWVRSGHRDRSLDGLSQAEIAALNEHPELARQLPRETAQLDTVVPMPPSRKRSSAQP